MSFLIAYNAPCMVAYGMQWNMHYTNCCSAFNLRTKKNKETYFYWDSNMETIYYVNETYEISEKNFKILNKYI